MMKDEDIRKTNTYLKLIEKGVREDHALARARQYLENLAKMIEAAKGKK